MVIDTQVLVEGLSVDYFEYRRRGLNPFGKLTAIRGIEEITFNLERGDVVALLGRNGAGKSTLLRAIAGKLRPSKGQVKTTGRVILLSGSDPGFFPDITGTQNILELGEAYGVGQDRIKGFFDSVVSLRRLVMPLTGMLRLLYGDAWGLGFGFMTGPRPTYYSLMRRWAWVTKNLDEGPGTIDLFHNKFWIRYHIYPFPWSSKEDMQ